MEIERIRKMVGTGGKKVLLYHTDVDGICSAALFRKFFGGFDPVPMEGPIMNESFLKELTDMKPSLIAALDIPLDQEWKKIGKLMEESEKTMLLIIDHHIAVKNMTSERAVHVNPRFAKHVYIPASVLVYRMLRDMGNEMDSLIWVAAMGVIGDYAYEDCACILDECEKAYPGKCKGKGTMMENLSRKLMSTVILDGIRGTRKSLDIMTSCKSYIEADGNGYLNDCYDKVQNEINEAVSGFAEGAEKYPELGLYIYKVESRLNIASTVSTRLASENPDKMILVIKPVNDLVKVSARYQKGDISLNDLFKEIVKGIGSGGGHEKAAGAVVKRSEWREFKNRLKASLTELRELM